MSGLKIGFGLDSGSSSFGGSTDGQAHVDIQDEQNLRKWEEVLHLSRGELIEAVKSFGPLVRDIRLGLRAP